MLIQTACLTIVVYVVSSAAHKVQRINSRANFLQCIDERNFYTSLYITALVSTLFRPIVAEAYLPNSANSSILGILLTGFKLETKQYNNLANSLSSSIDFSILPGADDADSSIDSLIFDAETVLTEARRLNPGMYNPSLYQKNEVDTREPLLLVGHSRGGAVAALAMARLIQNYSKIWKSNENLSSNELESPLPKLLLVLLDPVDTEKRSVVRALQESYSQFGLSQIEAGMKTSLWPIPVLIISTPYGGSSSYYKVMYESACAPLERNGDAFYKALKSEEIKESKPSISTRKDQTSLFNVIHVTLPDIGHTQLLDDRRGSTIASVCVGNEKIPDKDVRKIISNLIELWLSSSLLIHHSEVERKDDISKLKDRITVLYPNIRTEWSE